ncbi:MAG: putative acetyltransferase [Marmoricola sp.]|jgi:chorismate mutase/ribosomal protein S18 acetylase RimI-like enzyme|nr:putative acetyltransferase [Marmoricola sp.]
MLTELVLRPATAEDMPELAEVYIATRRAAVPAMPPSIHDDESVRQHMATMPSRREVWVAEDEQLVGFAALDDVWLDSLYVGPQHQGSGVGSALLDLAKSLRPDGFALWVFASNAPARAFYRRHGLIELEHTDGSANEERSPDVRLAWPGQQPLSFLRSQIDHVDDDLALLLARRLALTAAVQGYKDRPGLEGRDPRREQVIVERMAKHAPGLGASRIQRVMDAVITESLNAWEARRDDVGSG